MPHQLADWLVSYTLLCCALTTPWCCCTTEPEAYYWVVALGESEKFEFLCFYCNQKYFLCFQSLPDCTLEIIEQETQTWPNLMLVRCLLHWVFWKNSKQSCSLRPPGSAWGLRWSRPEPEAWSGACATNCPWWGRTTHRRRAQAPRSAKRHRPWVVTHPPERSEREVDFFLKIVPSALWEGINTTDRESCRSVTD